MEAYTSFAAVYDTFMDNIPYEEWGKYLKSLLYEYGVREGLVLELGCGTGNMTEILAQSGYDMIGVDNAEEMLEIAIEKRMKSRFDILYLQQDMRELIAPLSRASLLQLLVADCADFLPFKSGNDLMLSLSALVTMTPAE